MWNKLNINLEDIEESLNKEESESKVNVMIKIIFLQRF